MTGCRLTDVFTEIIYDQSADQVDTENETKFIISDASSKIESPFLSATEQSDEAPQNDEEQNLVVYSSDPNTVNFTTKETVFSLTPAFEGLETSTGVSYYLTDQEDALEYKVDKDKINDSTKLVEVGTTTGDEDPEQTGGKGDSGDSDKAGQKQKDSGGGGNSALEGSGGGSDSSDDDTKVDVIKTTGRYDQVPNYDHVAAYGEMAVIVQAIAGKSALVAADKELLSSSFTTVFAGEGANSIKQGWSGDGSSSAKMNVDKVLDSGAEAILCYTSDYQNEMSSSQKKKLEKAGISFVVLPSLTNTTNIKSAVTKIGEMFSESDNVTQDSVNNAKDYNSLHDELVSEVLKANGNELASDNGKTYEKNNSTKYSYDSKAPYTLLIDGYDGDAEFTLSKGTFEPKSDGAFLSTLGYSTRPTSYYIQVGGLVNNAATRYRTIADGKMMVVWQFNNSEFEFDKKYWKNYKSGSILEDAYYPSQRSWDFTLLTTDINKTELNPGASFGSSDFPTLIVTSQEAKTKLVRNSGRGRGLYTPYGLTKVNGATYFGVDNGDTLIRSVIGSDGSANPTSNLFSGSIPEDDIYVNPHGLFSSWTEGSMEGVLECAWIYDEVKGGSGINYEEKIKEFYKQVYRYPNLSDEELKIIEGVE